MDLNLSTSNNECWWQLWLSTKSQTFRSECPAVRPPLFLFLHKSGTWEVFWGIFPSLLFYTHLILKIHNELFLSSCSIASVYVKPVVNKSADFCTRISNCCVNSFEDSLSWDWRHVCVLMIIGCQKHNYFEKCSAGYFFFSGASYCG